MTQKGGKSQTIAEKILIWYDAHRRVLPWRALSGQKPNPYAVWVSEVMLQQTTVATVGPYFARFMERFPTVQSLADGKIEDIRSLWAGLGYYRRAHLLHLCAKELRDHWQGKLPKAEKDLLSLPGFGPYTAAAVRAIAFDECANVVDGNVERVTARLFAVETPLPQGKPLLREKAATLLPTHRFGDYAQSMMDLGASICTPSSPRCDLCPLSADCRARAKGIQADLPRRTPKNAKPKKKGIAFVLRWKNKIFLIQRPSTGLLAHMTATPTSVWDIKAPSLPHALQQAGMPSSLAWEKAKAPIRHIFTHFELELRVAIATIDKKPSGLDGRWVDIDALGQEALPSLFRKIVGAAL